MREDWAWAIDAKGTTVTPATNATTNARATNLLMARSLIPLFSHPTRTLEGTRSTRRIVDRTKGTIVGVIMAAVVALILVTLLTSVIRTIIELAIVVGAIYLIARVLMRKK